MMCVELRIRCSQPPSRGFSGSLTTFATYCRRSPELRHQLAVFLSDLTLESSVSTEERRVFACLSLLGIFGGHTSRTADHSAPRRGCQNFRVTCRAVVRTLPLTMTVAFHNHKGPHHAGQVCKRHRSPRSDNGIHCHGRRRGRRRRQSWCCECPGRNDTPCQSGIRNGLYRRCYRRQKGRQRTRRQRPGARQEAPFVFSGR